MSPVAQGSSGASRRRRAWRGSRCRCCSRAPAPSGAGLRLDAARETGDRSRSARGRREPMRRVERKAVVACRRRANEVDAPRAPGTSGRTCRLRSPSLQLRHHLELHGMQEPGSHGVGEHEQPVVRPARVSPFELPRLGVAEEVDFARARRAYASLDGEVGQELERRARSRTRVVAGLEEEQPAVEAVRRTTWRSAGRRPSGTAAAASRVRAARSASSV